MKGIELSRRFYSDVIRPWLNVASSSLQHSAALIGFGSELRGQDDEVSKDHNWGPRVYAFLSPENFDQHAPRLMDAFAAVMPTHFLGEPIGLRSRPHPPAGGRWAVGAPEHGLEIHTIEAKLASGLALESLDELDALRWLCLSEQRLLAFTAGEVFHDDGGRLGGVRAALDYFPRDIWRYKIECQWRRIAEEQAFVGRAEMAGDELGSRVITSRLVRDVMRMGFLLERHYAPYSKWLGSAFARLPIAEPLLSLLETTLLAQEWKERGEALAAAYLVLANRRLENCIGDDFRPVIGPYFDRPLTIINADDAVAAMVGAIEDPILKALPVVGSLDQVTDLTPVLENPKAAQRMMHALLS